MNFKSYPLGNLVNIRYGKNQKKVASEKGTFPIYGTGGLMGYATEPLYDMNFKKMIRLISQLRPISIVELPIKNQRDNYQRTS